MSLKIGFLLNSFFVPAWQKEIIVQIQNNPRLRIALVVLNTTSANRKKKSRWVYKFFMRVDRKMFGVKHDAFKIENVEALFQGVEVLHTETIREKFSTKLHAEDSDRIKQKELDVLIRFGFGILKGEILSAAKFGVWSLHHGDNAVNRGGPPGFWEVVNKEEVTGATLQQLTDTLDGGIVLGKSFSKTDMTSFNRNQNAVFWSGVELFCSTLNRVATEGTANTVIKENQQHVPYTKPLYRDPGNGKALQLFTAFWMRRLRETLLSLFVKKIWSIYYFVASRKSNSSPSLRGRPDPELHRDLDDPRLPDGQGSNPIFNSINRVVNFDPSLSGYQKLNPPAGTDWADPFVIKRGDLFYVFFEELTHKTKRGHISCLVFDSDGNQQSNNPVTVLRESHHLSYPFVFEHEGKFYMVPEAAESKTVWLYRCENFPDKWVKHKVLLKDVELFDPTLHFHEGRWYLFGTQKPWPGSSPDQYLYIYYADDLFGEWKSHKQNPLTRDVRGARPAGRIFVNEGKLIRPSQLGAPRYGYGVRFQEIITLTPEEFVERQVQDVLPTWKKGLLATHTHNFAEGFYVLDAQS